MEFYPKTQQINHKNLRAQNQQSQTQSEFKKTSISILDQQSCNLQISGKKQHAKFSQANLISDGKIWKIIIKQTKKLKTIFGCLTFLEFSLLLALIRILYISSKIQGSIFTSVLIVAFLIFFFLITFTYILEGIGGNESFGSKQRPFNISNANQEIELRTLPKIVDKISKRDKEKTKKMHYVSKEEQETQQKSSSTKEAEQHFFQTCFKMRAVRKKILIIIFKTAQSLIQILVASLSIFVFNMDKQQNYKLILSLSILSYPSAIISFFVFIRLLFSLEQRVTPNTDKMIQFPQQNNIDQQVIGDQISTVSISRRKTKNREIRKAPSIDTNLEVDNKKIKEHPQNQIKIEDKGSGEIFKQYQATFKQIKKSVLKLHKHQQKQQSTNTANTIKERKKVQIDSNNIQYFEYQNICPSVDNQIANTIQSKMILVKKFTQKFSLMKKKIQTQEIILRNKISIRETKDKSSINLHFKKCDLLKRNNLST